MKTLIFVMGLFVSACAWSEGPVVSATVDATNLPSQEALNQAQQRLVQKGHQIEEAYKDAMRQCYQKFDVVSCRTKARDQRIEAQAELRREELPLKAMDRQIKAEEAQRRLAERLSEAKRRQEEADRAKTTSDDKQATDALAQKQMDSTLPGSKRAEFEQKQRDAAQHRADLEKRMRDRNTEPAAPLPVPRQ